MAGRGRGRGSGTSLTQEQMQALGITRGDNTPQILTPPPLFPKLETKPLPLVSDAATDYMVIVKDQFIEYLQESPAFVKINTRTDGIERYSDKYKLLALNAKRGRVLDCVWTNMPPELRPQARKMRTVTRKRKLEDPAEIAKRLQNLESKEKEESTEDNEMDENEATVKKEGEDNDDDIEDEQEQEEEIDDGTDYANNYFDNGEDYEEEDDNLDDGPVY
ncbi:DNA-directed RNA polymerase III subunit RPC7-like [Aricia agestis]|uniref:DNA-directed RNA polymerase III subunit RPC7-like n=1 Tax=Aricia agestis TaxID=91739 RepID=UPI001C20B0A8|nr:DNA-directed RNA polymerase III subunit RPC7-like [Aricia agestis]